MKDAAVIFAIVFLMHGAASAQEKTLYDVSRDMFDIIESYNSCADQGDACTQDDARALESAARSSLSDLGSIIGSGSGRSLLITADQARMLSGRAATAAQRIPRATVFDGLCNRAVMFIDTLLVITKALLQWIASYLSSGFFLYFLIGVLLLPAFIFSSGLLLGSFALLAPCLFWWL